MSNANLRIAGLAGAVLMVVGGLGTWATLNAQGISLSVNGSDRDGAIVMVCAVIVALGVLVANRVMRIIALVAAGASIATAIYDIQDILGKPQIDVGWGLWLSVVASVAALGVIAVIMRSEPPPAAPPTV